MGNREFIPAGNINQKRHVHGFLGKTKTSVYGKEEHIHRFAGITGEAIPSEDSHIHNICIKTDYSDHLHEIFIKTGPAMQIRNGRHIHLAAGSSDYSKKHFHDFIFDTLAESEIPGK